MTNFFLWSQLIGTLGSIIATKGGAAPKEIVYINALTSGIRHGTLTDQELTVLHEKITREIQTGVEPTNAELEALEQRLLSRSEQIQSQAQREETVQERNLREQPTNDSGQMIVTGEREPR